jgi:hypothetical protein
MDVDTLYEIKRYVDKKIKEISFEYKLCRVKEFNTTTKRLLVQVLNTNTKLENVFTIHPKANYTSGAIGVPEINDVVVCVKIDGMWFSLGSVPEEFNPSRQNLTKMIINSEKVYYKVSDGSIVFEIQDGVSITLSDDRVTIDKELQADDYYSGDGTQGETENVTITEHGGGTKTFHFKDGLYVGYT